MTKERHRLMRYVKKQGWSQERIDKQIRKWLADIDRTIKCPFHVNWRQPRRMAKYCPLCAMMFKSRKCGCGHSSGCPCGLYGDRRAMEMAKLALT